MVVARVNSAPGKKGVKCCLLPKKPVIFNPPGAAVLHCHFHYQDIAYRQAASSFVTRSVIPTARKERKQQIQASSDVLSGICGLEDRLRTSAPMELQTSSKCWLTAAFVPK